MELESLQQASRKGFPDVGFIFLWQRYLGRQLVVHDSFILEHSLVLSSNLR